MTATKSDAKLLASDKAVEELKKSCWTIQVKKWHSEADVNRGEVLDNPEKKSAESEAIPDSNIGNKLLRMMGWTGGGVGKEGQGIAERVSAEQGTVINKEGLGLQAEKGIGKNFVECSCTRLCQIIQRNRSALLSRFYKEGKGDYLQGISEDGIEM